MRASVERALEELVLFRLEQADQLETLIIQQRVVGVVNFTADAATAGQSVRES